MPLCAYSDRSFISWSGETYGMNDIYGLVSTTARTAAATSSSVDSVAPSEVTVMTTGKMPRARSGPPVATSSSAASINASTATRSPSSWVSPGRHRFFSEFFAGCAPEPVAW